MAAVVGKKYQGKFRSQRRRKRPKQFMGWRKGQESPTVSPISASAKKLAIAASSPRAIEICGCVCTPTTSGSSASEEAGRELEGYRLVDCQALSSALSQVAKCSLCASSLVLAEDMSCCRGLVSRLSIRCSNTACGSAALF